MPKLHDGVDQRTIPVHLATITTTVTRMWRQKTITGNVKGCEVSLFKLTREVAPLYSL